MTEMVVGLRSVTLSFRCPLPLTSFKVSPAKVSPEVSPEVSAEAYRAKVSREGQDAQMDKGKARATRRSRVKRNVTIESSAAPDSEVCRSLPLSVASIEHMFLSPK